MVAAKISQLPLEWLGLAVLEMGWNSDMFGERRLMLLGEVGGSDNMESSFHEKRFYK